ncbi:hypothetical protein QP794_07485 [Paenibacillus sp. UMB7766-LJ446]|nr:hypothetical protein [Paenibacillus sp. UMB7766-LJ446]
MNSLCKANRNTKEATSRGLALPGPFVAASFFILQPRHFRGLWLIRSRTVIFLIKGKNSVSIVEKVKNEQGFNVH